MSLIRINKNPSRRQLDVFAIAWVGFVGLLGWVFWAQGRHVAAEVAWLIAVLVPLAGRFRPGFIRLVYLGLSYLTYPLGFAASYVALAAVYFLALAPIGLTMRLFRYDPLSRRRDPKANSYWSKREGAKASEDYFSQS